MTGSPPLTECAVRGVKSAFSRAIHPLKCTIDETRAVKAGGRQPVARRGSLDGPDPTDVTMEEEAREGFVLAPDVA